MPRRTTPVWRRALALLCLVLCCVAAPVALTAGWARAILLDQAAYVQTVTPVADNAQIQHLLAQAITDRVVTATLGETSTATQAVQARLLREIVGSAALDVVASPAFATTWRQANAGLYSMLAAGISAGWGEPVVLDLSPLAGALQAEIDAVSDTLPVALHIAPEELRVQVLDAATADTVRRALRDLDRTFYAATAVVLLGAILSIALAGDRLRALTRLCFGLAIGATLLIAALLLGQAWAAGQSGGQASAVALEAILDAATQGLRVAAIAAAAISLLLAALFAGLGALRGSVSRRSPAG
ncbi:MAG: hypothetical protein R2853_06340 [Thermomicrobiales bacterium]|nr:hypothetical protein [Thermomicrobiales bacterium]